MWTNKEGQRKKDLKCKKRQGDIFKGGRTAGSMSPSEGHGKPKPDLLSSYIAYTVHAVPQQYDSHEAQD